MADEQPGRHLLTVLHAAERTGPPLLALQFLRWLKAERPSWTLSTLFLDGGGPLVDEFGELGGAVVDLSSEAELAPGPRLATGGRDRQVQRTLSRLDRLDVVHVHCAGSMRIVPSLPKAPILCHVHELSVGQDFHLGSVAAKYMPTADRYVAVSDAVRSELLERFPIDPSLVDTQWGFVDESLLPSAGASPFEAPPGSFVVVGSGVRHWRKGPELFVRTAVLARERHPNVDWHFVWIGGDDVAGLEQLAAAAGLAETVRFVAHQPDPLRWIGAADAFLLTAREDAFPLVCVEAAALGRPIVSFDSGGTPELIQAAGCGTVVQFPDVAMLADSLAQLAEDPDRRASMGSSGRRFAEQHLMLDRSAPSLLDIIERTMGAR